MNSTKSFSLNHQKQFENFIPKKYLDMLLENCQRIRVFDPVTTLFCMIQQALNQSSYKQTVIDFNLLKIKHGQKCSSINTAAFCKAKQRMPIEVVKRIAFKTGNAIENKADIWKWNNREVYNIDGTVFDCEDTDKIKEKYPAIKNGNKTLGFPKIRLLGVFSMATGALLNGELASYSGKGTSEVSLLRNLIKQFKPNTILVLDRFFTSYFLQSIFKSCKLDYVIRARDEMAKKILGNKKEIIIKYRRPLIKKNSLWDLNRSEYLDEIPVKIIRSTIARKGFRTASIYIITSLVSVNKTEIEKLYLKRWNVELDIRNIKCTLNSKVLKSKSDKMAELEIWTNLIAYNLIRKMMCHLASDNPNTGNPREYSFIMAMKSYVNGIKILGLNNIQRLIDLLKNEKLQKSKYRREPRAIKRRNYKYPHLTSSRSNSIYESWGYSRRSGEKRSLNAVA